MVVYSLSNNLSYLEIVLHNKLAELNNNVDYVICANILEEMVCTIEKNIEFENNQGLLENSSTINLSSITVHKENNIVCDINDNYELLDLELDELDKYFIESLKQQSSLYPDYDLKCFRSQILSLLSNVCNELALKTPVIHQLKKQLYHIKHEHLSLNNQYFQMGLQILSTMISLKKELEMNQVCNQKLLDKIDLEMSQVLYSDSKVFPVQKLVNRKSP